MPERNLQDKQAEIVLTSGATPGTVMKETAKAILIDFGGIEKWLPKSQVEVEDLRDGVRITPEDWLKKEIENDVGEGY